MLNDIRHKRRLIIYSIIILFIFSSYIFTCASVKNHTGDYEYIIPYISSLIIFFTVYFFEKSNKKFNKWVNKKEKLFSEMTLIEKRKYKLKKLGLK